MLNSKKPLINKIKEEVNTLLETQTETYDVYVDMAKI